MKVIIPDSAIAWQTLAQTAQNALDWFPLKILLKLFPIPLRW